MKFASQTRLTLLWSMLLMELLLLKNFFAIVQIEGIVEYWR